jgi:hypothetical protein
MKPQRRFIQSVLKSAEKMDTPLPWQRGATRATAIARRSEKAPVLKRA